MAEEGRAAQRVPGLSTPTLEGDPHQPAHLDRRRPARLGIRPPRRGPSRHLRRHAEQRRRGTAAEPLAGHRHGTTTASHIHCCTAAPDAGNAGSAFAALSTGLNGGKAYLNIYSTFATGGEIRGFLHPAAPNPEPATWALAGLGLMGALRLRRA